MGFKSIELVSEQLIPDNMCNIIINKVFSINMPLISACFFSNLITEQFLNDVTQRNFSVNIEADDINEDKINKLYELLISGKNEFQTIDEKMFLLKTAFYFKSNLIKSQYQGKITYNKELSFEENLKFLITAYEIGLNLEESNINYIAGKFMKILKDESNLHDIFNDVKYLELLELILQSNNLKLENEDLLLDYVLYLCNLNKEFEVLIQYILLEYCTISAVDKLIQYVHENFCSSQGFQSALSCFQRRLLLEKLPELYQNENGRYSKRTTNKRNKVSCNYQ